MPTPIYTEQDHRGNKIRNADLSTRWDPALPSNGGNKMPLRIWRTGVGAPTLQAGDLNDDMYYATSTGGIWQFQVSSWVNTGIVIKSATDLTIDPAGGIVNGAGGLAIISAYFDDHFLVKDGSAAQNVGGDVTFTGAVSGPTPSSGGQLANKSYVDNIASGVIPLAAVRVAATANTSLSSVTTIDGITLATGDRVLLAGQTAPTENGIYVRQGNGSLARATDADSSGELKVGSQVFVSAGTTHGNSAYSISAMTTQTWTPNTTGTTWVLASQITGYQPGDGLDLNGTLFSVEVNPAGGLAVDGSGVAVKLAPSSGLAVDSTGLKIALPTGARLTRAYGATVTAVDGTTSYTVAHSLATTAVDVTARQGGGPAYVGWSVTDANNVAVSISGAPNGTQFAITIYG